MKDIYLKVGIETKLHLSEVENIRSRCRCVVSYILYYGLVLHTRLLLCSQYVHQPFGSLQLLSARKTVEYQNRERAISFWRWVCWCDVLCFFQCACVEVSTLAMLSVRLISSLWSVGEHMLDARRCM